MEVLIFLNLSENLDFFQVMLRIDNYNTIAWMRRAFASG